MLLLVLLVMVLVVPVAVVVGVTLLLVGRVTLWLLLLHLMTPSVLMPPLHVLAGVHSSRVGAGLQAAPGSHPDATLLQVWHIAVLLRGRDCCCRCGGVRVNIPAGHARHLLTNIRRKKNTFQVYFHKDYYVKWGESHLVLRVPLA